MTSESTRFLGQPKEIKPTVGAVGGDGLVTCSLYRGTELTAAWPLEADECGEGERSARAE